MIPNLAFARLLIRLFPFRGDPTFAQQSLEELRRRYFKWYVSSIAAFFVVAAAMSYCLHEMLVAYAKSDPRTPAVYDLRPPEIFWWAPAAFLSCVPAGLLVGILYRALLRERTVEYSYYVRLRAGFSMTRAFFAVGILFGAVWLAVAYFAAQSRLSMTENELVIRRIWSLEDEHYPYGRISGLREIYDRRRDRTIFVIRLAHAKDWSTQVEEIFPGEVEKAYLARRSGRPIERFEVD